LRPTLSNGLPFTSFIYCLFLRQDLQDFFPSTANARRRAQTFLPADTRGCVTLARDKLAGKKHVNCFAINNIYVPE
jgi:hypothetical protein